jgi:hypothetical protein
MDRTEQRLIWLLICSATALAGYITVVSGSGTPNGVITADIGQVYTDTANGNVWIKTSGNAASTGWILGAPSATGTITVTSGNATMTNAAITTSSYAVLTAASTNAPSAPYTFVAGNGTAAITGGTNTTTARYLLFNP